MCYVRRCWQKYVHIVLSDEVWFKLFVVKKLVRIHSGRNVNTREIK